MIVVGCVIDGVFVESRPQIHRPFCVPRVSFKPFAIWSSFTAGVPIVRYPVVVATKEVHQQIGNVVVDVEISFPIWVIRSVETISLYLLIAFVAAQAVGKAHKSVPTGSLALSGGRARIDAVPVVLVTTKVAGRK